MITRFSYTLLFILFVLPIFGQTEKEMVMETVDKNSIQGPIYFLADDLLKGRPTGSPENKIAASYLANELRSYGVLPSPESGDYYQSFGMHRISPPEEKGLMISKIDTKHQVLVAPYRLNTRGAEVVYLEYGLEDDYEGKDVSKKVVVIKGGSIVSTGVQGAFGLREKKAELARKAGALALVELIKTDAETWKFIDHNFNTDKLIVGEEAPAAAKKYNLGMPHFWVQDEYGSSSQTMGKNNRHYAKISIGAQKVEKLSTQNVIGVIEGTDPALKNEYIIYSAHYDHVGIGEPDETGDAIYNGARDNAVGVTTVLEMARNLAKYPTKRSALFIMFTGEESGLLGSEYYVNHPVLPLEQMVYCFNSDNGGYNDTSLTTIIGLPRTTAEKDIKDAAKTFGLTAIDDPAPEQGLFDRSDNVNFAQKGIPAPTFSMGFTAFNGDITKYYHQPGDEAESLDFDYLEKFFRAYVMAGRNIGNNPKTPFWTAGDKYESAGKKLYNKLK